MIFRVLLALAFLWPAAVDAQQVILSTREQQSLKALMGSTGTIEQLLITETVTHPLSLPGTTRIMVDSTSHTIICSFNGSAYVSCLGGGGGSFSLNGMFGAVTLLGTSNEINIVAGAGTLTFSTPQPIAASSNVTFNDLKLLSQTAATGCAQFVIGTGQLVNTLVPCGSGGGGSPGGATTQVQINDAGVFYADSGFVYDKTLKVVTTSVRDKGTAGGAVFNVKAYGAVCDGSTDDTSILQGILVAMSAIRGSTMFVPPSLGCAVYTPGLDLTGLNNMQTIEGPSGARVGVPSKLLYKSCDAGSLLQGKPSGLTLRNVGFQYDCVGYTGTLLNLQGTHTTPVSRLTVDHAYLGGIGAAYGASAIINITNSYDVTIRNSTFNNASRYIQGPEFALTDPLYDFANHVSIIDNHFQGVCTDIYIRAGGQSWTIDRNSVEPMSLDGSQVGFVQITPAGVLGYHEGTNWLGVESGATTGTYFVGGTTGVRGGVMLGNAQIGFAGGISARHLGASKGLLINDYLDSTTSLNFGTSSDVVWFGSQGAAITGRPTGVSLWSDSSRWNSSAPLWVDSDAGSGIPYKGFGRVSDNAASLVFYRSDRTTQTGFWTATTAGIGLGGNAGFLMFALNSGNIGIGTNVTAPSSLLTVNLNASPLPNAPTALIQVASATGTQSSIFTDSFGNQGAFVCRRANGTPVARTAVLSGEPLCSIVGSGAYDATSYSNTVASFGLFAAENFTSTAQGTFSTFGVVRPGTTTLIEALRLSGVRGVGFVTIDPIVISGSRNLLGTVQIPPLSFGPGGPTEWTHVTGLGIVDNDTTTYTGCTDPNAGGANPTCINSGAGSATFNLLKNMGVGFSGIGIGMYISTYDIRTGAAGTVEDDQVGIWTTMTSNSGRLVNAINVYVHSIRANPANHIEGVKSEMINFSTNDAGSHAFVAKPGEEANRTASEGVMGDAFRVLSKNVRSAGSPVCGVAGITCFAGVLNGWVNALNIVDYDQATSLFRIIAQTGETIINTPSGFTGNALHVRNNSGADGFVVSYQGDVASLTSTVTNLAGGATGLGVCVTTTGTLYAAVPIVVTGTGGNIDGITLFRCF